MTSENPSTNRQQFVCGICRDNYTTPRYLPKCGHTFCENCLLTYASNLQHQGNKLECPLCRKPHSLPENTPVTLKWIQTLPLNTAIVKMMKLGSESPEQKIEEVRRECDPCKERDENVVGLKYCMDCSEVYCKVCTDCHKGFKVSKHHKLVDVEELSSETKHVEFLSSFTKCSKHPERDTEFYCRSHDIVICSLCLLTDHTIAKSCDVVDLSSHVADATRLREESEKLANQIKASLDHLIALQTLRQENKRKLAKNLEDIRENIQQVRDQIVKLMDEVVSHVNNVTKQIEIEQGDKADLDTSRVANTIQMLEKKLTVLNTMYQHGSDKHKFISAKLMKSQVEEIGRKISEEDQNLKDNEADLSIADDLRKFAEITDAKKFVEVRIREMKSIHRHLGAAENYLRDGKLVKVEDHTVRPYARHEPWFYGVAMHKDGRVILADLCSTNGCGYLCVYKPRNKSMVKLKMNRPFSAVQTDDSHVAVGIPNDKAIKIVIIDTELRIEKTVKTKTDPQYIVALSNGELAVAWHNPPAFGVIDISGTNITQKSYFEQDTSGRKFKSFEFLAVDEKRNHVIQPCQCDKAVYCFNMEAEPMFKYTNQNLKRPAGIAVDTCGNIYVCDFTNPGAIHKLSPAGDLIAIVTDTVPSMPLSICSDNTGVGFWVTNAGETQQMDRVAYFKLECT